MWARNLDIWEGESCLLGLNYSALLVGLVCIYQHNFFTQNMVVTTTKPQHSKPDIHQSWSQPTTHKWTILYVTQLLDPVIAAPTILFPEWFQPLQTTSCSCRMELRCCWIEPWRGTGLCKGLCSDGWLWWGRTPDCGLWWNQGAVKEFEGWVVL